MAEKLYVRFSTSEDEGKIFDFYAENQHAFVAKREDGVWKERITSGAVTLIEDSAGKIVAASICYPIIVPDDKGEEIHRWTEIGSTRITLDGIGLFKTLLSAQILRAYLFEPPEDRFAAEIIVGNDHSKHVFVKNGAAPFDIPEEMRQKVISTLKPESKGIVVEWLQLAVDVIPQFARNILEAENSPRIVHKSSGVEYELDFSKCVLNIMFKPELESLSRLEQPQPGHGVRAFKERFRP